MRRPGGGRKSVVARDTTLQSDLEALLESSHEDEGHALDWTCKSIRGLAEELAAKGHQVSYRTVGNLLHRLGFRFSPAESYKKFSLASRRDQFRRLAQSVGLLLTKGEPVVALSLTDAAGQIVVPEAATAGLAASVLRHWWQESGARRLPRVRRMLLLLDTAGLVTGDRGIWAPLLQPLAVDAQMEIVVAHFPPGARRWRRSARELACSCSWPASNETDHVLTLELDLILPEAADASRPASSTPVPEERFEDHPWVYRVF